MGTQGLKMLEITHTAVTRVEVWDAFRQAHDARRRERHHGMLLRLDGKSCPAMAPWLYRDEDTIRRWVRAFNHSRLRGLERELIPGRPA